jgi:hypothetical protein
MRQIPPQCAGAHNTFKESAGGMWGILNKHFTSWPRLILDAARKHFPNSEEMHKDHSRKTPSGLRFTKTKEGPLFDDCDDALGDEQEAQLPLCLVKKEKTISYCVPDLADEATQKIGRTSRVGSQRNLARSISLVWYSQRAAVTSSLLKQ